MIGVIRNRSWREYAGVRWRASRSGSASSALASLGRPSRRDLDRWITVTDEGHDRYRQAHPVPDHRVAIVCVSRRPHLIEQVIDSVAAQAHHDDEQFPDVSLGEDRAFLERCHRRGISTFAADRFGFVQTRAADNTWTLPDADFLVGTVAADGSNEAFR